MIPRLRNRHGGGGYSPEVYPSMTSVAVSICEASTPLPPLPRFVRPHDMARHMSCNHPSSQSPADTPQSERTELYGGAGNTAEGPGKQRHHQSRCGKQIDGLTDQTLHPGPIRHTAGQGRRVLLPGTDKPVMA